MLQKKNVLLTRVYPVVFLLDAQWDFTLMQSIYGQQYFEGLIPEMVIVGITWGGNTPNYDSLRRVRLYSSSGT